MALLGSIISFIIIVFASGWITGFIFKKKGFGLAGNFIVGGAGALLGSVIFHLLGFEYHGILSSLTVCLSGSVLFIFILKRLSQR